MAFFESAESLCGAAIEGCVAGRESKLLLRPSHLPLFPPSISFAFSRRFPHMRPHRRLGRVFPAFSNETSLRLFRPVLVTAGGQAPRHDACGRDSANERVSRPPCRITSHKDAQVAP